MNNNSTCSFSLNYLLVKLPQLMLTLELADKSTLPILRKGLRDTSPKVIQISALLIRNVNQTLNLPARNHGKVY